VIKRRYLYTNCGITVLREPTLVTLCLIKPGYEDISESTRSKVLALVTTQPAYHRRSNVMSKRHLLVVAASGLMLACAACSSRPLQGMLTPVAADVDGTSRVSVLAATTRQRSANDAGEMDFLWCSCLKPSSVKPGLAVRVARCSRHVANLTKA